jgi:hypothetical protein
MEASFYAAAAKGLTAVGARIPATPMLTTEE